MSIGWKLLECKWRRSFQCLVLAVARDFRQSMLTGVAGGSVSDSGAEFSNDLDSPKRVICLT